jgi:hypothetical protein
MKVTVLLLALASVFTFAADNTVIAPQPTANLQSAIRNPQSSIVSGAEAITIPQMLSYQGKLTDTLGQPVPNSDYSVTLALYTVPSGGSAFWSEMQSVTTRGGLFSTLLGSVTPIGSMPDAGAVYLGMTVAGGAELTPRLRIASAAYSYLAARAANSDLLQGKDTTALDSRYVNEGQASSVTSNMMVDGTVAAVDLNQMGASSGQVMKWTGSAWAPRNDSVGSGGGGGTVTSVSQATGVVCTPNPITTSGTVGFDSAWGDARFINEAQANSITGAMIVDGTVSSADIRDTTVNTADLKDAAVSMTKINQAAATSGQAIVWNGSAWAPATVTAGNSDMVDGYHAGNSASQVAVSNSTVCTNLNSDLLDGSHATAFAPASGGGNYIQNQNSAYQTANWKIVGQGQDSSSTGTALRGVSTFATGNGVQGQSTNAPGVSGISASTTYGAVEGYNNASSGAGFGVSGFATGTGVIGVYGNSVHSYGVYGTSTDSAAVRGKANGSSWGVRGDATSYPGVAGVSASTTYGAIEGSNTATSGTGCGVSGFGNAAVGVYGGSSSGYGVFGSSTSSYGVRGSSSNAYGVYGQAAANNYAGVFGTSSVAGTGYGVGTYGSSPTYWGGIGYRSDQQKGSSYSSSGTRGGLYGYTFWGDTWTFGTAGYTYGDYGRTGGVIGANDGGSTWGSLGYRNSSGTWYAGYGTAAWSNGTGLSSHSATGIGCGYGGGLMGGWLKGTYYGATVSGDRYAIYTKGNNYTTGYSAVMQNTGSKREASYVPTSTTVDIYTSGVSEMKGGQAAVTFPASFASMVSKDVPVVVTATPMGPAPIYLSSSDSKGFAVAAVDAKASVKFSWIAVGRRAGYETNPVVPAELARTDFDSKMDGVMSDENDLHHPAQPVWFDGSQLRFDNPPEEPRSPKPAQPVNVVLQAPPQAPVPVVPARSFTPSTAPIPSTTTAPVPRQSATQSTGAEK